jgi:hypothetical protein
MYSASAGRDVNLQACGAGRIAFRGLVVGTIDVLGDARESGEGQGNREIFEPWRRIVRIDDEPSRSYRSSVPHSAISQTSALRPPSASDPLYAAAASPQTLIAPPRAIAYYDAFWQTLCASVVFPKISSETTQVQLARIGDPSAHRPLHDAWWT